jgi:hypothetical protein
MAGEGTHLAGFALSPGLDVAPLGLIGPQTPPGLLRAARFAPRGESEASERNLHARTGIDTEAP